MLFSVQQLDKSYHSEELLKEISFTVDEGQKIALIGSNGVGKSTLLKIITGEVESDAGTVNFAKGKKIAYLRQEVDAGETRTVEEYFKDAELQPHMYAPMLDGFGLKQSLFSSHIAQLSGGQQTKVLLTEFLLRDSDVLLLDEPTNNLDIPSLVWLEMLLSNSKKAMVIVSHDLFFLDNITNKVLELKGGKIHAVRGTYTDYLERKEKENKRALEEYKKYKQEITKMEAKKKDLYDKSKSIDAKNATAKDNDKQAAGRKRDQASAGQSQTRVIEKKMEQMEVKEKPFEEEPLTLDIHPKNAEGDLVIKAEDLVFGYKDGISVGPFSLTLPFGKKICVMGLNGIGKSTFLHTLTGTLEPIQGTLSISPGIVIGDVLQQHQRADRSLTAFELFKKETGKGDEKAFHLLKKMGIKEEVLNQKVATLSAGTRARLLFAIFTALGVNTLVLDEPTNHLDIEVLSALKGLLQDFKGTVILVSHNRWFLKDIPIDAFYEIREDGVNQIKDFESYVSSLSDQSTKMVRRLKNLV